MSPDELAQAGVALYGPRWQAALGRDLGFSEKAIQRWLNAKHPIPESAVADLVGILAARLIVIAEIMATIQE